MPESEVTVATFYTSEEAHIACDCLRSAGIDATIVDENIVSVDFRLGPAVGGVKLVVHQSDVARALMILKETPYPSSYRGKTGLVEDNLAQLAYRSAAFGLIFPPFQLYSIWTICRLLLKPNKLSPRNRRRVVMAAFLNLWLVLFIALWIYISNTEGH